MTAAIGQFATSRRGGLSPEAVREIEAHRAKDRPTPWQALAKRYAVPEADIRALFSSASEAPLPVASPKAPTVAPAPDPFEVKFKTLWSSNLSRAEIAALMDVPVHTVANLRRRLGLPVRRRSGDEWTEEQDQIVVRDYIRGGRPSAEVADKLGRTPSSIIGRAHRLRLLRQSASEPRQVAA